MILCEPRLDRLRSNDLLRAIAAVRRPSLTAAEFEALALEGVPYVGLLGIKVLRFVPGEVEVRLPFQPMLVRPGGTICGPAMMALADIALYGVVLSLVGRVELAVTTDLTMHFLRKPLPGDLVARGRILRLGRTLAVGEVNIAPEGDPRPVAHATGTYILPRAQLGLAFANGCGAEQDD